MVKTSVNVPRIGKTTWNCSKVNIFLIIYYFPFFVGYGKSEGKFKWLMSLKRSVCGSLRLFEKKIENEMKNMWSYLKSKWVYDFRFLESRIFWVCDWKSLTHLIKIERAINQSHIDVNWLNHVNSVIFIMNYKRYNGLNRNGDRKIAIIINTIIDAYTEPWILCGRRLMFWAYVLWKAPQTHTRDTPRHTWFIIISCLLNIIWFRFSFGHNTYNNGILSRIKHTTDMNDQVVAKPHFK